MPEKDKLKQLLAEAEEAQRRLDEIEAEEEQDRVAFPVAHESSTGKITYPIVLENTEAVFDHHNVSIRYNEMSKEQEVDIPGAALHEDNVGNTSLFWLRNECKKNGYAISQQDLFGHVSLVADRHAYHPAKEWIVSKPWDGIDRLPELYDTVISAHPMKEVLIRRWLLSAVAALYEKEGIAAQGMLVFVGSQGIGKTTWIKNLVGNVRWVKDGVILKTSDKDSVLKTVGHWIVEIGELGSTFKKSDIDELKAFVTEQFDVIRPPYMPKANKYTRRTVFYGSVDRHEFMEDEENRRFWTLDVERLVPFHKIDVQQLWAQVYQEYLDNADKTGGDVCWILTREELAQLRGHNEQFKSIDPIEQQLAECVSEPGEIGGAWLNATAILTEIGFSQSSIRKSHTNKVASWCRSQGFRFDKGTKKFKVLISGPNEAKSTVQLKSVK